MVADARGYVDCLDALCCKELPHTIARVEGRLHYALSEASLCNTSRSLLEKRISSVDRYYYIVALKLELQHSVYAIQSHLRQFNVCVALNEFEPSSELASTALARLPWPIELAVGCKEGSLSIKRNPRYQLTCETNVLGGSKPAAPKSITVIGGGISGLSAAYHASKSFPNTPINVLEASNRLGGWIQSERVAIDNNKSALLESGPRTLRPNGVSGALVLDLIDKLNLEKQLLTSSKTSPAARNRFIYHPNKLNQLPSSLAAIPAALLKHKTLRAIPNALLNDLRTPPHRYAGEDDESVDSFFRRRFGDRVADDIASAVIHGIYAADSRDLSLRFAFPLLYNLEQRTGSVLKGMFSGAGRDEKEKALEVAIHDSLSPSLRQRMEGASIFAFKEGISELVYALESALQGNNISVLKNAPVKSISKDTEDYAVETETGVTVRSSHLISSVPLNKLSIQPSQVHYPPMKKPDVAVVTLVYPKTDLPINGFGYLIPRSTPRQHNPHCALGVVIDSDAMPEQDPHPLTKLTVMLGGPYGLLTSNEQELRQAAIATVTQQLSQELHTPLIAKVTVQRECIPTYPPGHLSTLQQLHDKLTSEHNGRLAVVGGSYTGISVGDCVRSGWDVVQRYKESGAATGLERFVE
ncbi:hypothetical protein E3P99_02074 [Wallemia hederae]|uniref:Protoporphyrinogen oxidase n=1 Tax=Wallemia hederae TaxID=1540922 RepID=A0A4T0FM78_9BASI|nr:hypothetical protein E3P99_02074 [Wallemia hederae]